MARYDKPTGAATPSAIEIAQANAQIPKDRPSFDQVMAPHMQRLLDDGKIVVMIQKGIRIENGKRVPFMQARYIDNDPAEIARKKRQGFVEAEGVPETITRWTVREKSAAQEIPPTPKSSGGKG